MAGPQQQAANQQPTKRVAENEAQPAPIAKRMTQEPEEQNDIQDAGAVQPPTETNNEEVQAATNQEEVAPDGDDTLDESAIENHVQAANEGVVSEVVNTAEEDFGRAVAASVTTNDDDHTKVSEESTQNAVKQTSVEEDAKEPVKVVKEINTVTGTVAV